MSQLYDPQSAGINVQSPQSESTPRRLTLNLCIIMLGINRSRPSISQSILKRSIAFIQCNRVFSSQIKVIAEWNDAIIAFQTQRGEIRFRAAFKYLDLCTSTIVDTMSYFLLFQPHYQLNFKKSFYQRCGYPQIQMS